MKKILVLNFFPAFTPATSGGELRFFYMYKQLSSYFDITLLSPTYNDSDIEIIEHSVSFREYRIPKEDIHNEIHWKLEQEDFSPEFSALTCAYSADYLNEYHKYYLKLYPDADIIIHDFPYMLNYDLFFGVDNKPRIYNSHNLEYDLLQQIYKGDNAKKHLRFIFELEKRLVENSQIVFATSPIEKIKFHELYNLELSKIKLAPNGINPEDFLKRDEKIKRKTAFFIGSGHPPNTEAIDFVIDEVAPNCPDITFFIAGTCCGVKTSILKNVRLLGKVDEKEKDTLFKTSDIAINPMFSGAGTNLKTLEFLSMGIPMICTDIGVRGIDIKDGEHFILADKTNFVQKLNNLIEDNKLKDKISKKSKKYINQEFNWKKIAYTVYEDILSIKQKNKKTLLLINDFEVSNPFGGGEIRINKLYSELSTSYRVLLLCLNNNDNIKKTYITDNFLEISFPKTKEHKREEIRVNLQYYISATDIVNSYMINKNKLFMDAMTATVSASDVTVICHPYMYQSISKTKPNYLVYESLNFELGLKQELLKQHPLYDDLIKQTIQVESKSYIDSDLVVSVSDADHVGLKSYDNELVKDIVTIKNGVDIVNDKIFNKEFTSVKSMFNNHSTILFIGSAHMPNMDSVKYIIDNLADNHKDCYFIIIGSVCEAIVFEKIPNNVLLFGKLDSDYKNVLCSISDIAINPMFGGSGSNLKLAEYFSWKIPTITTQFGARGYDILNNKEAIICDIEQFSKNIKKLQNDNSFSSQLSKNSFDFVKSNLEWSILAKQYKTLLDKKVYNKTRKKILVVTYRFTNPPLGGAEVYMYELIKGLDKLDNLDITLVYLDSYDIQNQFHFSIDATRNTSIIEEKFNNVEFKKFRYTELNDRQKQENSKLLMKEWTNESLISANKFTNYYQETILLGGWNFPEKSNNSTQIWSSEYSEIYIKNTKKISIEGYSPTKKTITFKLDTHIVKTQSVNGSFRINLTVSVDSILSVECQGESVPLDIRQLGILVTQIKCDEKELNLSYLFSDYLKENYLSKYIDELIFIANQRDPKFDEIFQITRGLNSSDLEEYLDENVKDFDIILGHSIPFETATITSKYALKHNKPYTLLPHVHFDDKFYHWGSYYNAMQKADTVFASPAASIEMFYNKLAINTLEVPGGGINKDEYNNISSTQFNQLYKSDKPFFFSLGRKSGAKNYLSVVDAINTINKKEHICNLVMIGRDEDNMKIDSKYTYCLGEQPREVVLGALKECFSLVTMSESESFGIVIVEAWMLKKSVIINDNCPAFRELVDNEINGLYSNKITLVENMNKLLSNKDLSKKLGENGYSLVDSYSWDGISEKINNELLRISTNASL